MQVCGLQNLLWRHMVNDNHGVRFQTSSVFCRRPDHIKSFHQKLVGQPRIQHLGSTSRQNHSKGLVAPREVSLGEGDPCVWRRLAEGTRSLHTHYDLKRLTMALFINSRKLRDDRSEIEPSWCPSSHHVCYDSDGSIQVNFGPKVADFLTSTIVFFGNEAC